MKIKKEELVRLVKEQVQRLLREAMQPGYVHVTLRDLEMGPVEVSVRVHSGRTGNQMAPSEDTSFEVDEMFFKGLPTSMEQVVNMENSVRQKMGEDPITEDDLTMRIENEVREQGASDNGPDPASWMSSSF